MGFGGVLGEECLRDGCCIFNCGFRERRVKGWMRRPFTSDSTRRIGEGGGGGGSDVRLRMRKLEFGLWRRHLKWFRVSIC